METPALDAPAIPPLKHRNPPLEHRFTPANARMMAARANEARIKRNRAVEKLKETVARTTPQSEQIAAEMERLLGLMRKTCDADKLQKLSAARSRLLAEWQVLTGTPNPGARKSSGKRQAAIVQPEPIAPVNPPSQV